MCCVYHPWGTPGYLQHHTFISCLQYRPLESCDHSFGCPAARGSLQKKGGSNVTNQSSVSDWVVQVPLWPSGLGVGLWNQRPGIDTRTVRYSGGSGNPGSPVSGSSPPWLKVVRARGLGFQKGGSNVTNQSSVSDWVVQVPLWPSGLGVGLWNQRPGIDTRTVRYNNLFILI